MRVFREQLGGRPLRLTDAQRRRLAIRGRKLGRQGFANLGHEISRNTVKRILLEHGIAPVPERSRRMSWKTFSKAHRDGLAAPLLALQD